MSVCCRGQTLRVRVLLTAGKHCPFMCLSLQVHCCDHSLCVLDCLYITQQQWGASSARNKRAGGSTVDIPTALARFCSLFFPALYISVFDAHLDSKRSYQTFVHLCHTKNPLIHKNITPPLPPAPPKLPTCLLDLCTTPHIKAIQVYRVTLDRGRRGTQATDTSEACALPSTHCVARFDPLARAQGYTSPKTHSLRQAFAA